MWLKAPNIRCTHGFSTRHGGISTGAFASLNLGGSLDEGSNIQTNRELALKALGLDSGQLHTLKQVHGNTVCIPGSQPQEGDALVSNNAGEILAISIADCYPLLFHDPVNKVIGAAHAGWRGTVGGIAGKTVEAMCRMGAKTENIHVAIGQGICRDNFEVGTEVTDEFRNAGFPEKYLTENKIDLVRCNLFILHKYNIPAQNTWAMERCTFEPDFYSHRRDKGITGRMWGIISLNE
ncbi:MAG: laccase domain-containing protein [Bacteroidia bacterium]|nr:laccase domain-containing protein [Bacteroidia bacterium]